jgi:hypothetical protein
MSRRLLLVNSSELYRAGELAMVTKHFTQFQLNLRRSVFQIESGLLSV